MTYGTVTIATMTVRTVIAIKIGVGDISTVHPRKPLRSFIFVSCRLSGSRSHELEDTALPSYIHLLLQGALLFQSQPSNIISPAGPWSAWGLLLGGHARNTSLINLLLSMRRSTSCTLSLSWTARAELNPANRRKLILGTCIRNLILSIKTQSS